MPTKSGKELYREAFLKVKADRGTPYDVSQEELDAMSTFSDRNFGPFVSQTQATKEVVDHNKPSRKPSSAELAAIQRLRSALKDSLWSPDIVIKAFHDLDMIFFLGHSITTSSSNGGRPTPLSPTCSPKISPWARRWEPAGSAK